MDEGQPYKLRKEDFLDNAPVFHNVDIHEEIYRPDLPLSALHMHEFVEISYVASGTGYHRIWNQTAQCGKGDMYIINKGVPHGYFSRDGEPVLTIYNLLFDPADLYGGEIVDPAGKEYCFGLFSMDAQTVYLHLQQSKAEEFLRVIKETDRELRERERQWEKAVAARLALLMIDLARLSGGMDSERNSDLQKDRLMVQRITRCVMEQYGNPDLTLEQIAGQLFLSKSSLSRSFRRMTGEYFSDYLRSVRLHRACELLVSDRLNVAQIASRCGFRDLPHFYRIFKKQYHMTPNDYRKQKRRESSCQNCMQ